jgi:NhaA family Na+:H+ antiporter
MRNHAHALRHHAPTHARHYVPVRRRSRVARAVRFVFDRFLLLPLGVGLALLWANTAPESYFTFAQRLAFPVNEIGMAFFFALITQEVMEATMPGGALHSWRKTGMALVAAIGGAAGAVFVYFVYVRANYQEVLLMGWPIVLAIDAVAAYYVVKAILPRSGAVPFALLVAIATDIFGMVIVAPRYINMILEGRIGGTALVLVALGLAALFRWFKVRAFWPYLLVCGSIAWIAFYWEGLHPAFALVPVVVFLPREPRRDVFADPPDDDDVHHSEHEWNELVQFIVFLFGLVNGGVILHQIDTGSWAMLTAQLVGRPAGMLIAVGLALLAGLHLPRQVGWREMLVIALAVSSGFTVGLFFATGVLATGPVLTQAKIGILMSAVSGVLLAFAAAWAFRVGRFTS